MLKDKQYIVKSTEGSNERISTCSFSGQCFNGTYFAVLIGWGSKLPCASTETCLTNVEPELEST